MAAREPETPAVEGVHFMTLEEGRQMFDEIARKTVNMSGEEFIHAWESGKFDDQSENTAVSRLVALIPITR